MIDTTVHQLQRHLVAAGAAGNALINYVFTRVMWSVTMGVSALVNDRMRNPG